MNRAEERKTGRRDFVWILVDSVVFSCVPILALFILAGEEGQQLLNSTSAGSGANNASAGIRYPSKASATTASGGSLRSASSYLPPSSQHEQLNTAGDAIGEDTVAAVHSPP